MLSKLQGILGTNSDNHLSCIWVFFGYSNVPEVLGSEYEQIKGQPVEICLLLDVIPHDSVYCSEDNSDIQHIPDEYVQLGSNKYK